MIDVASALCDGVHQTAAGLAELRFVTSAGHLEFLNYVFAELIRDACAANLLGEKGVVVVVVVVVVVGAVHGVVVEVPRNAVKADHTEIAVCGGAGSQENEVGEITAVEGQGCDTPVIDDVAEGGLRGINGQGIRADIHG